MLEPRREAPFEAADQRVRLAVPILIGRPDVIRERVKRYGLRMNAGEDFEIVDPERDPRYRDYVATYLKVAAARASRPTRRAR